jgi:hypothetical protein
MWNEDEESYWLSALSRTRQSSAALGYSDPETLTTDSSSSVRSPAFFFAFFRLLRSLSRCLALCISFFDIPGLLMSSSCTTRHYFLCQVGKNGSGPCLARCAAQSFCSAPVSAFLGTIHGFPWVYAIVGHYFGSCL